MHNGKTKQLDEKQLDPKTDSTFIGQGTTRAAPLLRGTLIIILVMIALLVIGAIWLLALTNQLQSLITLIGVLIGGVLAFVGLLAYLLLQRVPNPAANELRPVLERQKELQARLEEKPDIFNSINLQQSQLLGYYIINQNQAKNSFRVSISAIIAGFIVIIVGVVIFYSQQRPNLQFSALSGIAGVLLQFIGGAYFFIYRKSLGQLNLFFNQLTKMQDTLLAITLTRDEALSGEQKVKILQEIILALMARSSSTSLKADVTGLVRKSEIKDNSES